MMIQSEVVRGVFGGVPSFFKACCWESSKGGTVGYDHAGWHLANAVGGQVPYDVELDEWVDLIDELKQHLDDGDDDAAVAWFATHFPR
jgi:hypothetical protein